MQNKQANSFLNNFGNTLLLLILVVQLSLTDSLNTGMINVEKMNRLLQINHFYLLSLSLGLGREDTLFEAREAAILFSDIRDFTTISENATPESITAMLQGRAEATEIFSISPG